nr:reverse transcriptase domain-containing protein [Tanacetum cinerariifolium]
MIKLGIASVASLVSGVSALKLLEGKVGHNPDECMHLKSHIEELIKAGKLSHTIKELRQGSEKDQLKAKKKGETSPSPYNGIIGRPKVRKIQAVPSTAHKMLKFLVLGGILTTRSSMIIPLECTMVSRLEAQPSYVIRGAKEKIKVAVHPEYPEQTIAIGSTLTEEGRKELGRHVLRVQGKYQRDKEMHEESDFQWTTKGEATFKQMKKLLAELPTLTEPMEKKKLIVYLVAASHFIVKRLEYDSLVTTTEVKEDLPDPWTLFMDGSSCIDGSGTGLILTNPEGIEFTYALRFRFDVTNNEAEYKALIAGLRIVEQMGIINLQANVDLRLVDNQVNGSYIAKESGTIQYIEKVRALTSTFKKFSIKQSSTKKSINEAGVLAVMEEEGYIWMTPIYEYLTKETLLAEKEKARAAHRTMIKSSNEDTPFSLTYGTKAVIPVEIGMPTLRTAKIDMAQNDEALKINLDLLEEKKGASSNLRSKKQGIYGEILQLKVRNTSFKLGGLVYRNNDANHAKDSGKLSPKWEGPYEVTEALGKGAYKPRDRNGKLLSQTWNVINLKKCYVHEM